jgi:hypothetical protein
MGGGPKAFFKFVVATPDDVDQVRALAANTPPRGTPS